MPSKPDSGPNPGNPEAREELIRKLAGELYDSMIQGLLEDTLAKPAETQEIIRFILAPGDKAKIQETVMSVFETVKALEQGDATMQAGPEHRRILESVPGLKKGVFKPYSDAVEEFLKDKLSDICGWQQGVIEKTQLIIQLKFLLSNLLFNMPVRSDFAKVVENKEPFYLGSRRMVQDRTWQLEEKVKLGLQGNELVVQEVLDQTLRSEPPVPAYKGSTSSEIAKFKGMHFAIPGKPLVFPRRFDGHIRLEPKKAKS